MSEQDPIKVAICIPSGDEVKTSFALSLVELVRFTRIESDRGLILLQILIDNIRGSDLAGNRNLLVERAIEKGADYVLFLDSDMIFPPDTLCRLLCAADRNQLEIIGCTYPTRHQGGIGRHIAYDGQLRQIDSMETNGIQEVALVGTGVLLIATRVFSAVSKPWFMFIWNEEAQEFQPEDHSFCHKARAAGYRVFVDFTLSKQIGHIGSFTYTVNESDDLNRVRENFTDLVESRHQLIL